MKILAWMLTAAACLCAVEVVAQEAPQLGQAFETGPGQAQTGKPADIEIYESDDLSGRRIDQALSQTYGDRATLTARGPRDVELYRKASPSVVLVVTSDGLGSGVYIGSDQLITNWHVVGSQKVVGVIFKPATEGEKPTKNSVVRANVLRTDAVRDLALLRVTAAPDNLKALEFGNEKDIQIGADVHAIGHPTGAIWTYTKGLISQVRKDYQWRTKESTHRANVIQTQTPISPGSSGGPLIADNGKLVGINSFGATEGQSLNFAVAVDEVERFLKSSAPAAPAPRRKDCQPAVMYEGRSKDNSGRVVQYDTNCDGRVDLEITAPDNTKLPIVAQIDSNYDGKIDIVVMDTDRDGKWDVSYHDVDHDGKVDVVGYHPDGKLKPSRFEKHIASR